MRAAAPPPVASACCTRRRSADVTGQPPPMDAPGEDRGAPAEGLSWERVDARLRELLELEPEAQQQHLDGLRETEPGLARRLARLLDASSRVSALNTNEVLAEVAHTTFTHLAS